MTLAPKTPSDTRVTSHALMLPEHANHMGHVHGGWIMKLVDENGGLAATRHSRRTVVTVAVEGMVFHRPVVVGSVLQFDARLVWAGRTSMEVEVKVSHEDPIADTLELVHTARMVYVALGIDHRPAPVPPLRTTTPEEDALYHEAQERKAARSGK